jgi:1-aminocyclopropane-1-carboxylate deaminase
MRLVPSTEAFIMDPVYEGKSMARLIKVVRDGEVEGNVLFAHSGGQLANNAYEDL